MDVHHYRKDCLGHVSACEDNIKIAVTDGLVVREDVIWVERVWNDGVLL
jgi:hypothetical protein